jgi:hypothetical protein
VDAAIAQSHVPGAYRRALSVKYVPTTDQIAFQLDDGVEARLPPKKLQGLEHATATQIEQIKIMGPGTGLVWPARDVAHGIPGLIDDVFGTQCHMAEIARAGGSKRSAAKRAQSGS